ncbi:protein kinase, partial [Streptomyces fulvissimus]
MADTRLIQSRYRLLDLIGRGGMGEVWRARDESLGRLVAVKCLKPMGPQHDQAFTRVLRERFRREARVAASLQHRGITVVHDFGEHEGVLYLVMELLDGHNLSQLLEGNQQRPLPVEQVVDIAEQVADALGHTHRQGIVHRDLKPANIMRLTDGTVKICDFGIARLGHDIGVTSRLTTAGIAMGTPHYMSPEQIGGKEVDHRSDLYSLGCVLYEIATGVPPFDLDDAWAVLVGHRDTQPEPLRTHRAELPGFFDRVVLDLLAKAPDERPADAGDLRRRIVLGRTGEQPVTGLAYPSAALTGGHLAPPPAALRPTPERPTSERQEPDRPAPDRPNLELPAWAGNMTSGHKATGSLNRGIHLPDPAAGLTGRWTTATSTATAPQPGADGSTGLPHTR